MTVPASVERKVPREIVDYFDIIDRIGIEMNTSGFGDRREQRSRDIQVRLFEFEDLYLAGDETNCGVLYRTIDSILPVANILPPYPPST